jgi:hypothetical protein
MTKWRVAPTLAVVEVDGQNQNNPFCSGRLYLREASIDK